jgi:hypothetical protein
LKVVAFGVDWKISGSASALPTPSKRGLCQLPIALERSRSSSSLTDPSHSSPSQPLLPPLLLLLKVIEQLRLLAGSSEEEGRRSSK